MIDVNQLNKMIAEGYVVVQKHPHAPLYIYNYTAKTQYEGLWNAITLACRGLILDENANIIARPFPKFFNLSEHHSIDIPKQSFEVFEKMDGSLGILYWYNDTASIATRGSFTSLQAIEANKILNTKYAAVAQKLDRTKTYLFEIIYPENRIVVDYDNKEDIILLAIIDTLTGKDESLIDIGFPLVNKYNGIQDVQLLQSLNFPNQEGFVIKYANGFRVKIKFEEYLRLHKIVTNVSNKTIWMCLMNEQSLESILDRVPDEFYNWVKQTEYELKKQYMAIEHICQQEMKIFDTQKETALYFMTCTYPNILFLMQQNKSYAKSIWKLLQPQYAKPFQINE